jgi:hypothetical protein
MARAAWILALTLIVTAGCTDSDPVVGPSTFSDTSLRQRARIQGGLVFVPETESGCPVGHNLRSCRPFCRHRGC